MGREGVWRWGMREIIYHYHTHTRILKPFEDSLQIGLKVDTAKMGRDESHVNVSLIAGGQSHLTVSTDHNF